MQMTQRMSSGIRYGQLIEFVTLKRGGHHETIFPFSFGDHPLKQFIRSG